MALPVTLFERKYETDVLKYESLNDYSRETVTVKAGNGVLDVGTVLGLETATAKFSVATQAAAGGLETPRAVLLRKVDATAVDVVVPCLRRGPAKVMSNGLIWGPTFTTQPQRDAGVALLEAATGIITRRGA